ncbi:hypothetical protein FRC17_007754, partial [Serendipita sp. 399]
CLYVSLTRNKVKFDTRSTSEEPKCIQHRYLATATHRKRNLHHQPFEPPTTQPTATPIHTHFGKANIRGTENHRRCSLGGKNHAQYPHLQANSAPLEKPTSLLITSSSTASSAQERLKAPDAEYLRLMNPLCPPSTTRPIILTALDDGGQDIALATGEFEDSGDNKGSTRVSSHAVSRAASHRLYNVSLGARSVGRLPVPEMFAACEASFYGDGVSRVDPFIAEYGQHKNAASETFKDESRLKMKRSFESLMPWLAPPLNRSTTSSLSGASISSLNDSQPELVAV